MLGETIQKIERGFGIEFVDYEREGEGVLITSGAGIGMAMMDTLPWLRYMIDLDSYRFKMIDWEAVAVLLSVHKPKAIVMVGWFTIDRPRAFEAFIKGVIDTPLFVYRGGESQTLGEFISCCLSTL